MAIVAGNPVLLFPAELARMINVLKRQAAVSDWLNPPVPLACRPGIWYAETLKDGFGLWWTGALVLCSALWGVLCNRQKWLLNVIILSWAVPTFLYIVLAMRPEDRYLIPVFVPLLSCLANPMTWDDKNGRPLTALGKVLTVVTVITSGIQLAYYARTDVRSYCQTLTRERNAPAIMFYQEMEQIYLRTYLSSRDSAGSVVVLCDSYVYVAPSERVTPTYSSYWSMNYRDCERTKPDLVVLERYAIDKYADAEVIHKEVDQEQARRSHEFYSDAKNDTLKGFRKVFETEYGVAFARDK
jgi:hypothetical protein